MNNIDRSLVKSQAKQIIKNKVFVLFIISIIVILLTGGIENVVTVSQSFTDIEELSQYLNNPEKYGYLDDDYDDDLDDFYENGGSGSSSGNPIESFGSSQNSNNYSNSTQNSSDTASVVKVFGSSLFGNLLSLISFALAPLAVTLAGYFVLVVKRGADEEFSLGKDLKSVFKGSFDSTYGRKLLLYLLRSLFTFLWSILLIVPGIVYSYSTYFAYQIACENPNLKPTEVLKLSKKMVMGNRPELFWLDVSFIGWCLLCCVTFGIASIYVTPYYMTTQALYYQNFKIRALQDGRITADDFISKDEKAARNSYQPYNYPYGANQNAQQYYYNPYQTQQTQQQSANTAGQQSESANYQPPVQKEPIMSGEYPSYAAKSEQAAPENPQSESAQSEPATLSAQTEEQAVEQAEVQTREVKEDETEPANPPEE